MAETKWRQNLKAVMDQITGQVMMKQILQYLVYMTGKHLQQETRKAMNVRHFGLIFVGMRLEQVLFFPNLLGT